MTIETLITAGLVFLPIIGSVVGYIIGHHDAQKLYQEITNEAINKAFEKGSRIGVSKVQKKHGKWIEINDDDDRISGRCSACGWEAHLYEDDVVGMPFCPSCGADMRGEQNAID